MTRARPFFVAAILLSWTCFSWGCTPTIKILEDTVEVSPYPRDPTPEDLVTNCRSQDLDACDALDKMNEQVMELERLNEAQHADFKGALKQLSRLIGYEELPPAATVTAKQPDTDDWTNPEGKYPTKMVVRIEYKRGLERMKTSKPLSLELTEQVKLLSRMSKKHKKAWAKKYRAAGVVLPPQLKDKRKMGSVRFELADRKPKTVSNLPADLLDKYIRRDRTPWAAKASHVISEPDLRYRAVKSYDVTIQPALTVVRPGAGKGKYVITESAATRDRFEFTSKLKAEHFCETLRAEMRFYPLGGAPQMKVSFRPVSKRRGSR